MVSAADRRSAGESRAFDHRDDGTSEERWAAVLDDSKSPRIELSAYRQLVVVAAHPDDETLGAGGLLAAASRAGLAVTVLVATLGEKSHPQSRTHSPDELARVRCTEVLSAIRVLAPAAEVSILGLPDGELAGHLDRLRSAVDGCIQGQDTLLAAPFVADGHPDHEAAGAVTTEAAAAAGATSIGYPIWMWHWGSPQELPASLVRLDLDEVDLGRKREALRCHRSQTEPLSEQPGDEAIVSPDFAAHFDRGYEVFVTSPVPGGAPSWSAAQAPAAEGADAPSLSQEFFDDFYGDAPDPWGFETRWYEERKRALTLASLPRQHFVSGYEPGCSIGVLTQALAARCDTLLATDISEAPLRIARRRLEDSPGVRFEQRRVPRDWPSEQFDLVVLSEIGYYCDTQDLDVLVRRASSCLTAKGVLVACHWRHPVPEYPLSGDDVHEAIRSRSGLDLLAQHREADFLLEVYVRPPAISVAGAAGLLD